MKLRNIVLVSGVLLIGAVGMAAAQTARALPNRPVLYAGGEPGSAVASSGLASNETITIEFVVERDDPLANIIAVPAVGNVTNLAELDTVTEATFMTPATRVYGNVGYVFVETNYEKWDLLISTKHGGYLRRDSLPGDLTTDLKAEKSAPPVAMIADPNGGCVRTHSLTGACLEVDSIPGPSTSTRGVYLKDDAGKEVALRLGIGTIRLGSGTDIMDVYDNLGADVYPLTAAPLTALNKGESFVELKGLGPSLGNGSGVVSVATQLGALVARAAGNSGTVTETNLTSTGNEVTATGQCVQGTTTAIITNGCVATLDVAGAPIQAFSATGAVGSLASDSAQNYFTQIIDPATPGVHGSMTGISPVTVNGIPKVVPGTSNVITHNTMLFYVNAMMNAGAYADPNNPVATAGPTQDQSVPQNVKTTRKNKNGRYYEDIYFTFWGVY